MSKRFRFLGFLAVFCLSIAWSLAVAQPNPRPTLWQVYQQSLKAAKYVDLTHTITPTIPVWAGFGSPKFSATTAPKTGRAYTYAADGFEATHYDLPTDQLGTQLDPPAHWNPDYPAIDELPPTFAVRPLVVIPIEEKVAQNPNYHLQVQDILNWEKRHGPIPEGSVVFVRSNWSKEAIGYAKFQGGLGGYARYIAICPPDWKYGVSVGQLPESPLPKAAQPLHWDERLGVRVR